MSTGLRIRILCVIGSSRNVAQSARFLNRVISYTARGIEFEADQRLVEALVHGLGLKDGNTSPTPGTKAKPIKREDHQQIIERRLGDQGGGNCTIANLKAQIGEKIVWLR